MSDIMHLRRLTILLLLPLLVSLTMKGQRVMQWEEFVEYLSSNEDYNDLDDWDSYLEELQQLHLHPLNINTASAQQLQTIPFLSELQIEQIMQYRDYHRGMNSINELILLTSISYYERQFLPLFLFVEEKQKNERQNSTVLNDSFPQNKYWLGEWKKSWKYQQHELSTRIDIPLYHRRGYLVKDGYRGSPIYNRGFYRMDLPGHLSFGIKIERDAGERGIDSHGGYLQLQDIPFSHSVQPKWKLQSFIVGDFKASFGQGLIVNQGFGMGKSNVSIQRRPQGFRPSRSTDEVNFMRGVASTISYRNLILSLFYSHRSWDATLNTTEATGKNTTVKTIVSNGYHRTASEHSKKGVLSVNATGGNLTWQKNGWHIGATSYYQTTNLALEPGNATYRQIYPKGRHFGSLGTDYCYEAYRWRLYGETSYGGSLDDNAKEQHTGLATFNAACWRPSARYTLSAIQRFYSYHYYSFYSSALAECGTVQNETGGMVRLDATPWDGMQFSTYFDAFYNPWPRYGLKESSAGWDAMLEGDCMLNRLNTIKIRYNVKQKEQAPQGMRTDHRLRLQWLTGSPSGHLRFTTSAMFHLLKNSYGKALGCMAKYEPQSTENNTFLLQRVKGGLEFSASGIYFHTTNYDSRIYLYEPNVSETMYIPSFSGHGIRGSGIVRCTLFDRLITLELKYGVTRYFDRDTQGSSLQTIYSNVKNDITLQAKLRL